MYICIYVYNIVSDAQVRSGRGANSNGTTQQMSDEDG